MSLVVFSAAAQVSAASLLQAGTPTLVLVGTVLALNAQMFLLNLTVGRQLQLSWPRRLVTALFLTDGAYGIAVGTGPLRLPVLLGAGASMFAAWNVGTALGTSLGQAVPDGRRPCCAVDRPDVGLHPERDGHLLADRPCVRRPGSPRTAGR